MRKKAVKELTPRYVRYDVVVHDTVRGDMTWFTYSQAAADAQADDLRKLYPQYTVEIKPIS